MLLTIEGRLATTCPWLQEQPEWSRWGNGRVLEEGISAFGDLCISREDKIEVDGNQSPIV